MDFKIILIVLWHHLRMDFFEIVNFRSISEPFISIRTQSTVLHGSRLQNWKISNPFPFIANQIMCRAVIKMVTNKYISWRFICCKIEDCAKFCKIETESYGWSGFIFICDASPPIACNSCQVPVYHITSPHCTTYNLVNEHPAPYMLRILPSNSKFRHFPQNFDIL